MPYEAVTIRECTLFRGDMLEILPTLGKVDSIVTDPPYGLGMDKRNAHSGIRDDDQWEDADWDSFRPRRAHFDVIRAATDTSIIWGGNYFTDYLPPSSHWLVWDKGNRDYSLADCEFAWSSQSKATRIFDYPRQKAIQDGRFHPTQKPVAVMAWCLRFVSGTVCDPFMGSGTTGVACVNLGRRFIGVEKESHYFDVACKRIEQAYNEWTLLDLMERKPMCSSSTHK